MGRSFPELATTGFSGLSDSSCGREDAASIAWQALERPDKELEAQLSLPGTLGPG